ncbi:Hin recombinase [Corticibacter populi]|uniref:Hin recombinase n=1 Tax=Corticibacter populi TaxID=1550736 RepID=A0A3M6R0U4_9BURK|nr:Hin recombinase [Corticibacter populi]RMX08509.1 Hin recombinase [Corticibacter populi]RZS35822.1 hypothetical protein EV687_0901 [Corticibacter populi]
MGRKSRLTPEQWDEVERRHFVDGESVSALAREFGIDEAAIRRKISPKKSEIRKLAEQKVAADAKSKEITRIVEAMPPVMQAQFQTLTSSLTRISQHLASAAEYGSATAHRLSALAHAEVSKVDDADPLNRESLEAMKGVAALTKLANESSSIALNLLAANKEAVTKLNEPPAPEAPRIIELVAMK